MLQNQGGRSAKCASPKPAFLALLQVGKKMYRALHANLHVFSSRQRKFLEKDGRYRGTARRLEDDTGHLDEEDFVELENGLT